MSIKEIIKHDFRYNRMMEIIYILKAMEGGGGFKQSLVVPAPLVALGHWG